MSSTSDSHKPSKPKSQVSSLHSSRNRRTAPAPASSSQSTSHVLDEESKKLKSQYGPALNSLRELFPDWKDEDLLAVLAETDGSIEESAIRITEGMYINLQIYLSSCITNFFQVTRPNGVKSRRRLRKEARSKNLTASRNTDQFSSTDRRLPQSIRFVEDPNQTEHPKHLVHLSRPRNRLLFHQVLPLLLLLLHPDLQPIPTQPHPLLPHLHPHLRLNMHQMLLNHGLSS